MELKNISLLQRSKVDGRHSQPSAGCCQTLPRQQERKLVGLELPAAALVWDSWVIRLHESADWATYRISTTCSQDWGQIIGKKNSGVKSWQMNGEVGVILLPQNTHRTQVRWKHRVLDWGLLASGKEHLVISNWYDHYKLPDDMWRDWDMIK